MHAPANAAGGPWCLLCGLPGTYLYDALDDAHAVMRCSTKAKSHDIVLGTWRHEEWLALYAQRREAQAAERSRKLARGVL